MQNRKKKHTKKSPKEPEYWIFGKHACIHALQNPKRKCNKIYVTKNTLNNLAQQFPDINYTIIDPKELEPLLPNGAIHQGIAIEVSPLPETALEDIIQKNTAQTLIILDQVTDPHNIGAILRSAAAFNTTAVVTTTHNAPNETGVLAKSASGALEEIPLIKVTNLASSIDYLKKHDFWCWGFDGTATATLTSQTIPERIALILGAEGKGLRKLTREKCDLLVKIPIGNKVESLNVSNAAAIALYTTALNRK